MEPLDTPDMTGPQSEKASSMTTLYIRLRVVNRERFLARLTVLYQSFVALG